MNLRAWIRKLWWILVAFAVGALVSVGTIWGGCILRWIYDHEPLTVGILAFVTAIGALFWARERVRHMEKDRHSDLILRLSQRWESDAMRQSREAVANVDIQWKRLDTTLRKARKTAPEYWIKLLMVANFFEDVGFLTKRGYLYPRELIMELFSGPIEHYYKIYERFIKTVRVEQQREGIYEWFEKAYEQAVEYDKSRQRKKFLRIKTALRKLANLFK